MKPKSLEDAEKPTSCRDGLTQMALLIYVELKKLLISNEYESNPCSYEHNLSSSENMALKKFRPVVAQSQWKSRRILKG